MLVQNTKVIDFDNDKRRLQVKEALHINIERPTMNIQTGVAAIPLPSFSGMRNIAT